MRLFNSLSGKKEELVLSSNRKISIYVCGMTVYDDCHIGHARTFLSFDMVVRYLRFKEIKVNYIRNITDVDDKILARANENKEEPNILTTRYIERMTSDFNALGMIAPDKEPKATENIGIIIDLISKLIESGNAYHKGGDVYFSIDSFSDYGKLSNQKMDEILLGNRIEIDENKKNPADFVLWKKEDQGLLWDSPWGKGRPGWHIECSVMAEAHLGEIIDIHGGGQDLIFPHHENELAQSSCTLKHKSHCRYWMHNGLVSFDKEKMSKSIGNILLVNDLLKEFPGEVIRLALLSSHYRQPLDWNSNILDDSQKKLDKLYGALRSAGIKEKHVKSEKALPDSILGALNDDLNTPLALAELFSMAKDLNLEKNEENRFKKAAKLRAGAELLGLLSNNPEKWFTSSKESTEINHQEIEILLKKRDKMRKDGFYAEADQIRIKLEKHNIIIEDSQQGAKWRRKR